MRGHEGRRDAGRTRSREARRGASFGDVLLIVSAACLAAALLYPGLAARAHERHLEDLFARVETARASAERMGAAAGTWPATHALPAIDQPPEARLRYRMEWRRVAAPELAPPSADEAGEDRPEDVVPVADPALWPPRPSLDHIGIVSVHTPDAATLQALLERYGPTRSFAHDTVWSLVLPRTPEPSTAPP